MRAKTSAPKRARSAWWRRLATAACALSLLGGGVAHAQKRKAPAKPADAGVDATRMAEAKKNFDTGMKLFKEGLYRESLAAFLEAKKSMARESIQRNIARCHRELRDFASAHDAYTELLEVYGAKMKPADAADVRRALDELRFLTGTVSVEVDEAGARVRIGDRDLGETPLPRPVRFNLGPTAAHVAKAGFETQDKPIEVKANELLRVTVQLVREATTGRVVVTADGASGAKLFVDGEEKATLPWEGELSPGPHELIARGQDLASIPRQVDVQKGQRLEVVLKVETSIATLAIEVGLADAVITLDGNEVGHGAWEGKVQSGTHAIAVRAPGYEVLRRVVLVRGGESVALRDLQLVAIPPPAAPPYDYAGLYSQLDLLGGLTRATNQWASSCVVAAGVTPSCNASGGFAGGLSLRVGYNLEWLGLEGFVLGMYDQSKASAGYAADVTRTDSAAYQGVARSEDYVFRRYGGAGGVALRATSKHESIRLTGAVGGGVSLRRMVYRRDASVADQNRTLDAENAADRYDSDTAGYTAPMAMVDAGILLGSSPGTKFHLGGFVMMDFLPGTVSANGASSSTLGVYGPMHGSPIDRPLDKPTHYLLGTPPLQLAKGMQLTYGITLGLWFGN